MTVSIAAILKLANDVLKYLNDVKDAPKERRQCAIEVTSLYLILQQLDSRREEGGDGQRWFTAVRALAVENGPLEIGRAHV